MNEAEYEVSWHTRVRAASPQEAAAKASAQQRQQATKEFSVIKVGDRLSTFVQIGSNHD